MKPNLGKRRKKRKVGKKKRRLFKAVDFFCGAGGITCGFQKAGINVLGGIDIDASFKETYEKNHNQAAFVHADISKLSAKALGEKIPIRRNDDRLIFVGCSPCQYYSQIQTSRKKSIKSRLLLEDFQKFVNYFKPGYVVVENVPGFETKKGTPLKNFKEFLVKSEYKFKEQVVNAVDYNVPQKRKRYLLIATRVCNIVKWPKQVRNVDRLIVRNYLGVRNGFSKLENGEVDPSDKLHAAAKLEGINLQRITKTPKDGGSRHAWKSNKKLQLKCYVGKDNTFPDVYGRMSWNMPAPTLTTKFNSITNGRFGHPVENRAISLREGAVLQTFPKRYKFISKYPTVVARMIGNAVPPEMAKQIAKAIIN